MHYYSRFSKFTGAYYKGEPKNYFFTGHVHHYIKDNMTESKSYLRSKQTNVKYTLPFSTSTDKISCAMCVFICFFNWELISAES